jgi:hypothetical protein
MKASPGFDPRSLDTFMLACKTGSTAAADGRS